MRALPNPGEGTTRFPLAASSANISGMETPEKLEAIELLEQCLQGANFGILDIDTTMIRLYHAHLLSFSPKLGKKGDHHTIKVHTTSKGKELIKDYRDGKFAE